MELKIGILLPRSEMFPTLALDFLNGCKLAFKNSMPDGMSQNFIVEGIGNATDSSLLKIAEKFILQEDVDITLAFCGSFYLTDLIQIFNSYKKPLIRIDLGGSVLTKEHLSPYVLHHTLNIWQSAHAAGKYAAHNYGKKVSVMTSIYDGGYHLAASFVKGYTDEGGEISSYYGGPMDYKSENFLTMVEGIREAQPDVIFGLFSFKEGNKIFDVLAKSDLNGKIPILVIPVMTDETINTEDHNIENVHSVASWAFDDENPMMQDFVKDYKKNHEVLPNIIGLLGYEVGLTVTNCITSEGKIASKLSETLQKTNTETPRGKLYYNAMNESQLQTFKLRKFQYNETKYHNTVIDTLDATYSEKLYKDFEELPEPAWQNPYICT